MNENMLSVWPRWHNQMNLEWGIQSVMNLTWIKFSEHQLQAHCIIMVHRHGIWVQQDTTGETREPLNVTLFTQGGEYTFLDAIIHSYFSPKVSNWHAILALAEPGDSKARAGMVAGFWQLKLCWATITTENLGADLCKTWGLICRFPPDGSPRPPCRHP